MNNRLDVSLAFSPSTRDVSVGQIGWDASRSEAVAEWSPDLEQAHRNISPLLVKS
ncbi:hypothetical protein EDD53_1375 [Pacificibacter maritimus]|uniref:Uncharacterized protein n=1 Tax=Pacificibacter maritimus TaxID=762213 RepID=A0A3N4U928_9RHOB|nr:hypothetical protein EDD53_1375 [Pacificibacter maritimus]